MFYFYSQFSDVQCLQENKLDRNISSKSLNTLFFETPCIFMKVQENNDKVKKPVNCGCCLTDYNAISWPQLAETGLALGSLFGSGPSVAILKSNQSKQLFGQQFQQQHLNSSSPLFCFLKKPVLVRKSTIYCTLLTF